MLYVGQPQFKDNWHYLYKKILFNK